MKRAATAPSGPVKLAVTDLSSARTPGQFRLTIEPDREWVRHEIVGWSVGLKWLTLVYHNTVHEPGSPLLLAGRDAEYLRTVEDPSMEAWMQGYLQWHMETHDAALLHGLSPGGANDLPVERIQIDRLLKEMAVREGVDVHGPAEEIGRDDDYIQLLANNQEYMGKFVGDRRFQLKQLGIGLPVLSTWLPLGRANYCGHAIDLDHKLPETICLGVIGRQLGDLVATGLPRLDARVITEVVTSSSCLMDHWPEDTKTRLYLEPDLVELGARPA